MRILLAALFSELAELKGTGPAGPAEYLSEVETTCLNVVDRMDVLAEPDVVRSFKNSVSGEISGFFRSLAIP